ncbi:type III-B CRISPR module-associated protein Cmr3 [Tengunoibacter tsumagoiensis]|uniref:Type III-B CRISPR module-associated protein Cmr3 n=1 Tax=Tengunoibacter tsumagoiensis TaxID=2014871 RepID=A0A402A9L7_9CHLR|nr:type III-B CRISPR module-associated protein Cmr3 [Tengunoibacter tsumagoiensis]GCE15843.1 type III-B CRISPR module-associated protein Cmr3 [Tengunoibacter tsumagoiensis]
MRIYIEPGESLMFRTGRPFQAGEDGFAESLFPPTPETIQGALRAAIATQWGLHQRPPLHNVSQIFRQRELLSLIGDRHSYGRFRITGLTLGRRRDGTIERLFPVPAHIIKVSVGEGKQREERFLSMHPLAASDKNVLTNTPEGIAHLLYPKEEVKMSQKAAVLSDWMTPRGLHAVLHDDLPSKEDLVSRENIYTSEPRLGIGIENSSKTTKEGHLYQAHFVRMSEGYGFVIDIALGSTESSNTDLSRANELQTEEELSFLQDGWLTIGGEQRSARLFVLDRKDGAALQRGQEPELHASGEKQFLYFATPAFFQRGWLPPTEQLRAPIVTAAINKYQTIGGWALEPGHAGGSPKTTHRCVPAGSIYFFDTSIQVSQPLTEHGWQIGYGLTYTGVWR